MGRLIEGGAVGRPDGKNLQILDLHRLASLGMGPKVKVSQMNHPQETDCCSIALQCPYNPPPFLGTWGVGVSMTGALLIPCKTQNVLKNRF